MYYINAISSITNQDTFDQVGFCNMLKPMESDASLCVPDYKQYIEPGLIRRMSIILRMSVATAVKCLRSLDNQPFDAIIVGTGSGCLANTEKFLNTFIGYDGLLPPTAFIQSTHNTIAGQISLTMNNHGYNMTMTQNSLSFELALQDAMMSLDEGMKTVLVGAADEHIPLLETILESEQLKNIIPTSGATFLGLSKEKTPQTKAVITDMHLGFDVKNAATDINNWLELLNLNISDMDHVVVSNPIESDLKMDFDSAIHVEDVVGHYPTNTAFGLHVAVDLISSKKAKQVLVVNHFHETHLGLMLINAVV